MADTKISALASLAAASVDDTDLLVIVDVADTSMAASGTDKRITIGQFNLAMQRRDIGIDTYTMSGALFP